MNGNEMLERIRTKAYYLWEKAGRPDGGDLEFWDQAHAEIAAEDEEASSLDSEG